MESKELSYAAIEEAIEHFKTLKLEQKKVDTTMWTPSIIFSMPVKEMLKQKRFRSIHNMLRWFLFTDWLSKIFKGKVK